MQSVKNGFAPPFSLCFSKSRAARQSPFCKAVARPFQSRRKALPKSTKTGRKSVGFLILTQAPKCTRSHCFPPQKHPKNGFMMRFAGKNSFFQLRARDFSFYMNAYRRHVLRVHPPGYGCCRPGGAAACAGSRACRGRGRACASTAAGQRERHDCTCEECGNDFLHVCTSFHSIFCYPEQFGVSTLSA